MVDEDKRGPWVLLTRRVRAQRGPGRDDLVVERPVKKNRQGEVVGFLDDPASAPTLVTFDEHCRVDVDFLVRAGAIRAHQPASTAPAGKAKPRRASRKKA